MNQKLQWLRENDQPYMFGHAPHRLVARCEDCGENAQQAMDRYDRQKVYEFVMNHEGHQISVGKVGGES